MLNAYLFAYVSRLFGGAWLERNLTPLPLRVPMPNDTSLNAAVDLIANAKRPVLLLGSQAVLPPIAPQTLADVVEVKRASAHNSMLMFVAF